jgi:hypothetical protein
MTKPRPRPKKIAVRSRRGDWHDYAATLKYLADETLTEDELELLHRAFTVSADNRQTWDLGREVGERVWRGWLERVLRYEVTLKAAGRAVVRGPEDAYRVEIQWVFDRKTKMYRVKSVHVVADDFLNVGDSLPVGEHFAAFQLRASQRPKGSFARAPRSRPAPGQPADPDFYRRLLDAFDRLVAEGHRSPAVELAERMDVNHSTVKSWLRRGREYLQED